MNVIYLLSLGTPVSSILSKYVNALVTTTDSIRIHISRPAEAITVITVNIYTNFSSLSSNINVGLVFP